MTHIQPYHLLKLSLWMQRNRLHRRRAKLVTGKFMKSTQWCHFLRFHTQSKFTFSFILTLLVSLTFSTTSSHRNHWATEQTSSTDGLKCVEDVFESFGKGGPWVTLFAKKVKNELSSLTINVFINGTKNLVMYWFIVLKYFKCVTL